MHPFWLAIIAYILGIIIATQLSDVTIPYTHLLTGMGILIIVLYILRPRATNHKGDRSTHILGVPLSTRSTIFTIIFLIILILCGFTRTISSIHYAKQEYGDRWQRSVYHQTSIDIPFVQSIHSYLTHQYATAPFGTDERSIIEAMTIGNRGSITKERRSQFSRAGVSHVLALSGMHITIIYIFLQYLLSMHLSPLKWRRVANAIIIIIMWIYAMVAGMSPSLIRAVTMCTFLSIGYIVSQRILSSNSFALSAFIILLFNPLMILHVGFQLSYVSIIAILSLGIPLCQLYTNLEPLPYLNRFHNLTPHHSTLIIAHILAKLGKWLWCGMMISLVCSLYTAPLVAYYFGQIPLLSPISNIGVSIASTVLIVSNGVWLLTGGWVPLAWVMDICATMILLVTEYFSTVPHAVITFSPTVMEVILAYIILVCSTLLLKAKLKKNNLK